MRFSNMAMGKQIETDEQSGKMTTAEKKAARAAKIKARLQSKEVEEFTEETVVYVLLHPYDQNGNKQGKWMSGPYKFDEWYYDMNGNPVFFSPAGENDDIGDLYNSDSTPYMDFNYDDMGNPLPIILITAENEYFSYIPSFELKLPTNIHTNTKDQD